MLFFSMTFLASYLHCLRHAASSCFGESCKCSRFLSSLHQLQCYFTGGIAELREQSEVCKGLVYILKAVRCGSMLLYPLHDLDMYLSLPFLLNCVVGNLVSHIVMMSLPYNQRQMIQERNYCCRDTSVIERISFHGFLNPGNLRKPLKTSKH